MDTKLFASLALVSGFMMAEAQVGRADLIINGGFETGDYTGWTLSGATTFMAVDSASEFVFAGNFGSRDGQVGALGFLSQTLATVPGTSYNISYVLENFNFPTVPPLNEFQVIWGGNVLVDLVNADSFSWTTFNLTEVATSASTTITFGFRQDPSYWGIDNISVNPPAPIPDGGLSAALLGLGLLGSGLYRRQMR